MENKKLNLVLNDLALAISNAKFDSAIEANVVKEKYNDVVSVYEKTSQDVNALLDPRDYFVCYKKLKLERAIEIGDIESIFTMMEDFADQTPVMPDL